VRVYLDTGIFIDYLSSLSPSGLRTAGRRGRSLAQLSSDAADLLKVLAQKHQAATSCLTYYEVEEALYKQLATAAKGIPRAAKLLVPAARSLIVQTQVVIKTFGIRVLDLNAAIVDLQIRTTELQKEGIRAADALHVATALEFKAELIVSTDHKLLKLHESLSLGATKIKCLDVHAALQIL
jgi:predicted nucleic acid-binding protein